MTKQDLIEKVYLSTDVSKKDITIVVNSFLNTLLESVKSGERIELRGFGTFYLSEKKERQVYSPIAQKKVDVSAGYNVMFKSSKAGRTIKKGD